METLLGTQILTKLLCLKHLTLLYAAKTLRGKEIPNDTV